MGGLKSAVVTGASGFLGRALCRQLRRQDYEVTAVIRPESARRERLKMALEEAAGPGWRILELGLGELEQLPSLLEAPAELFFHLAWEGAGGMEREDFDIQERNIGHTARAVRAAKACGCQKFIGAGSQAEYGVVPGRAREKETAQDPFLMYGAAKLAAGQMGKILAAQLGLDFLWCRIYSVYGEGENQGTLVRYLIDTLSRGGIPQLTACENRWNFLHVADCARALCLLGETREAAGICHVASEDTRLLRDFVEEIRDVVCPEGQLAFGTREVDSRRTFWLDPDCAMLRSLGFSCQVEFREGIRREKERIKRCPKAC